MAVTPGIITLENGDTHTFSAVVNGDNNPPHGVSWTVEGQADTGTFINSSGLLTVGPNETTRTITVRATSVFDAAKSGTATVTIARLIIHDTYTVTFMDRGAVYATKSVILPATTVGTLPANPANGGYTFGGWYTGMNGSGTRFYDITNVSSNMTVYAYWISGGSSGGGNSSSRTIESTYWIELPDEKTLANEANKEKHNYAQSRSSTITGIRKASLIAMAKAGLRYRHDTVAEGAVQVRVYIDEPGNAAKDILVSGYISGAKVERTSKLFEKWFNNRLRTVHMDQKGSWDIPVRLAVRLDLSDMDANNLYFYSYDSQYNKYRRIRTEYRIDKNGYLHFATELAGDIIVSDGPLAKNRNS